MLILNIGNSVNGLLRVSFFGFCTSKLAFYSSVRRLGKGKVVEATSITFSFSADVVLEFDYIEMFSSLKLFWALVREDMIA